MGNIKPNFHAAYPVCLIMTFSVILILLFTPEYENMAPYLWVPYFFCCLGVFYKLTAHEAFVWLAMIGFAVFIPIGLLGMYGLSAMMDGVAKRKFECS